jgi:hypothetical protein
MQPDLVRIRALQDCAQGANPGWKLRHPLANSAESRVSPATAAGRTSGDRIFLLDTFQLPDNRRFPGGCNLLGGR